MSIPHRTHWTDAATRDDPDHFRRAQPADTEPAFNPAAARTVRALDKIRHRLRGNTLPGGSGPRV